MKNLKTKGKKKIKETKINKVVILVTLWRETDLEWENKRV